MKKLSKKKIFIIIFAAVVIFAVTLMAGALLYIKIYALPFPTGDGINCIPGGPCIIIENEGKISVSKRPEVKALAEKYGWEHTIIQALDIDLVRDIEFIQSIHPQFKAQTGCIIVVKAGYGGEGYIYQEDKELNVIYQMTLREFIKETYHVDSEIMAKFYLSLH